MAADWLGQSWNALPATLQQWLPSAPTPSTSSSTTEAQSAKPGQRPPHWANDQGTLFKNPWPSARPPAWNELAWPVGWKKSTAADARKVAVRRPDFTAEPQTGQLQATWLGHASVLLRIPLKGQGRSFNVLTDPIFSLRAGPTQVTGVRRFLDAPCQVPDLPPIDAVLISHNHYDHLDLNSIVALRGHSPDALYFVPLRIGTWLTASGVSPDCIRQLDWWDDVALPAAPSASAEKAATAGTLRFTCVPAQHNSGRAPGDAAKTLWAGWVVELYSPQQEQLASAYFAGDTGYRRFSTSKEVCPIYKQINDKFGALDLSFLPIWRGGSLGFISYSGLSIDHDAMFTASHSTPRDAVDMHLDLQSRHSVAIHFATFVGAESETLEATSELAAACKQAGVGSDLAEGKDETRFVCLDVGESCNIPCTTK